MLGDEEIHILTTRLCRQHPGESELIDSPETPSRDIEDSLRDQALVNQWLGGAHATLAHVLPILRETESDPVRVLELACGGADLSRKIVSEARKLKKRIEVTALDLNPKTLFYAREHSWGHSEISFLLGSALQAPFISGAFDIVMAPTFLHHLSPEQVIEVMREARRISRGHVVIADLVRSSLATVGIKIFGRLTGFNEISIHDGVLSVCHAYTPAELNDLAKRAGLTDFRIYRHRFYRMALVYEGTK